MKKIAKFWLNLPVLIHSFLRRVRSQFPLRKRSLLALPYSAKTRDKIYFITGKCYDLKNVHFSNGLNMVAGGQRQGAGRPRGSNRYGEPTKAIRIPVSRIREVQALIHHQKPALPWFSSKVKAGFPSPADDHIEHYLDLNEYLVKHPAATFILTASGESMLGAGIRNGDLLIVDRSVEASHGKIVIAAIDGELTVKRLSCHEGRIQLLPENSHFSPIDITDEQEVVLWGVVTHIIHQVK